MAATVFCASEQRKPRVSAHAASLLFGPCRTRNGAATRLDAAAQVAQQVVEGEPGKRALIHAAQNLDIAVLKLRGRAHQVSLKLT